MLRGSRAFSGKIHRPFLAHVVPPLATRISWRWLVAKVGTFKNKKVHKHLHLWPLGPHRQRLVVRSGTSKGSTINQYGCSTFGALATKDQEKEEEEMKPLDPRVFPWCRSSVMFKILHKFKSECMDILSLVFTVLNLSRNGISLNYLSISIYTSSRFPFYLHDHVAISWCECIL